MKVRTMLQGAGAAALVLYPIYSPLASESLEFRMRTFRAPMSVAAVLIINLVVLGIAFAGLGSWLRRGDSRYKSLLRLILPAALLASIAEWLYLQRSVIASVGIWLLVFLLALLAGAMLHWIFPRAEHILLKASYATLMGLGVFCLIVLVQLVMAGLIRPFPNSTQQRPSPQMLSQNRQRIVWILLDELSYNQVFGHRYPGLALPNFDAFRASATLFTEVAPVQPSTEVALPSIMLGRELDRIGYTYRGGLTVAEAGGKLQPFDAAATPFALARQHGLTAGVVGWYNPYCRMLAPYLNECYWTYEQDVASTYFVNETFWKNLTTPFTHYWIRFLRLHLERWPTLYRIFTDLLPAGREQLFQTNRVSVYRDLLHRSETLLQQTDLEFVFLHLPLPHPPGFYNRATQQFDVSGDRSYIDNLALADRTLGQLLGILEVSSRWKDTSVVICGDHSWRTYIWQGSDYYPWTAESQAAAHGVYDPRPVLMVHQPGQTQPATVGTPFPLLRVHDILDALITRQSMPY